MADEVPTKDRLEALIAAADAEFLHTSGWHGPKHLAVLTAARALREEVERLTREAMWHEDDRLEAFQAFGGRIVRYDGAYNVYLGVGVWSNSQLWAFKTKEEAEAKLADAIKRTCYSDVENPVLAAEASVRELEAQIAGMREAIDRSEHYRDWNVLAPYMSPLNRGRVLQHEWTAEAKPASEAKLPTGKLLIDVAEEEARIALLNEGSARFAAMGITSKAEECRIRADELTRVIGEGK